MIEPARLAEADVAEAGRLLARAFVDDPGTSIVEPDPARRLDASGAMFELVVQVSLGSAWAAKTGQRLAGVALWLAPNEAESDGDDLIDRARSVVGAAAADRAAGMFEAFEQLRQQSIATPHWFLALLGVDPEFQGRGVGSALMRIGHEAADMDGRPCFLETFTEPDVAYYQRRGYALTRSTTIVDGVPIHAMTRPPQDRV